MDARILDKARIERANLWELAMAMPIVELLLCAADLSIQGAAFGLTEAVGWLGVAGSDMALVAAYEALAVANDWGTMGDIGAMEYLEAAYRVAEGRGVSS